MSPFARRSLVSLFPAALLWTVACGDQPLAVDPRSDAFTVLARDGGLDATAWIANETSGDLTIVDVATASVTGTVTFPSFTVPRGLAVSPDDATVYVANGVAGLWSVDAGTGTVLAEAALTGFGAGDVAVTPDGTNAFVTLPNNAAVSVVDLASMAEVAVVPVGTFPSSVAVTPDGSEVWVASFLTNSVAVIETATLTVVAQIPVGGLPTDLAVSPDGSRVYTADSGSSTVSVVDAGARSLLDTYATSVSPRALDLDSDGARIHVAGDGVLEVLDAASGASSAQIALPVVQPNVELTPGDDFAYVTDAPDATVSVVDLTAGTLETTLGVGDGPHAMVMLGGAEPDEPTDPVAKDECKKGGWEAFGFRNQGRCIQFVNTGKDSR